MFECAAVGGTCQDHQHRQVLPPGGEGGGPYSSHVAVINGKVEIVPAFLTDFLNKNGTLEDLDHGDGQKEEDGHLPQGHEDNQYGGVDGV